VVEKTAIIHLRDKIFPARAIHFILVPEPQLTGDESKVTCRTCLGMIERQKKLREKQGGAGDAEFQN
jgi:hypothetical protein